VNLLILLKKNVVYATGLIYLLVLLIVKDIPVFWDMYGQVKTASYFLETGFSNLLPSGGLYSDNGHLPLYPLYLAILFKLFGFKLWVAHLSVLPFLIGTLHQLQRFCRHFLNETQVIFVLALTFFMPAFITQSIYFSNEIALVFASLWFLNALLDDRSSHIAVASVLLCVLNLRGISLCLVLLVYFLFLKKNKNAWYILCGLVAWLTWLVVHYRTTGWFFSGEEIKEFRELAGAKGIFANAVACVWKLADLGAVFGWVAVIAIAIKRKVMGAPLTFLALASLSVVLTCLPFTNPVSNRYFLLVYVLLLPAFVHTIGFLQKKMGLLVTACFAVVLFSNNGVMYPNQYGNAWDCSLKSLSYFEMRKQLDAYLSDQKIPASQVEAGFQLYFNDKYYLMNGADREFALLSDTEMPRSAYVANSDICNNYNPAREKYLAENYASVKEFKQDAVYIRLYKRLRP